MQNNTSSQSQASCLDCSMATSADPLSPAASGWAGLPRDILWDIFLRIPQDGVLCGAGLVCSSWRSFARDEPMLWRRIDVTLPANETLPRNEARDYTIRRHWKGMVRAAVDRSAGICEEFIGRADNGLLLYLAQRAPRLRILSVISHCDVSSKVFAELLKSFPLLEELELELQPGAFRYEARYTDPETKWWAQLFQAACTACSNLSSFRVRNTGDIMDHCFQIATIIPQDFVIPTMHGLHSIHLFGCSFSRDMVLSIVDCCPNLQALDISDVPSLRRYDLKLQGICSRINNVILPESDMSDGSDDEEKDSTESDNSDYFSDE